ncbi:MAG: hypothetical protein ACOY5B_00565 [Spirochaetota bacterium]
MYVELLRVFVHRLRKFIAAQTDIGMLVESFSVGLKSVGSYTYAIW